MPIDNLDIDQLIAVSLAIIFTTVVIYGLKIAFSKAVDRYYNTLDKVNDLINQVTNLITEFKSYKETTNKKDEKIFYQINKIENEMATGITIEKEHYNELKGKVSKTHDRINSINSDIRDLTEELIKVKTEHKHHYGKGI